MAGSASSYLEYQRRHLSPEMFAEWLAINPGLAKLNERQMGVSKAVRDLTQLQDKMLREVMGPAIKRASSFLARVEKGVAGQFMRTGTLAQAIGTIEPKLYYDHLTAWIASGPRRGYGRVIRQMGGGKLKRGSAALTKQSALGKGEAGSKMLYANPVKYARLLISGRKAVTASPGHMLKDSFTGTFFGHSVKEARPRNFMASAEAGMGNAASIAEEEINSRIQQMNGTGG